MADPVSAEERFRIIFLKKWAPAIITALLGGLLAGLVIPYANSYFERQRVFEERRTRLLESLAESFTGVVAHTGKVRGLEKAITDDKRERDRSKPRSKLRVEIEERIERRRKELRETEVTLYGLTQTLEGKLWVAKFIFGAEVNKEVDEFRAWRAAQGDTPIEAAQLTPYRTRLMAAMVKEMGK